MASAKSRAETAEERNAATRSDACRASDAWPRISWDRSLLCSSLVHLALRTPPLSPAEPGVQAVQCWPPSPHPRRPPVSLYHALRPLQPRPSPPSTSLGHARYRRWSTDSTAAFAPSRGPAARSALHPGSPPCEGASLAACGRAISDGTPRAGLAPSPSTLPRPFFSHSPPARCDCGYWARSIPCLR